MELNYISNDLKIVIIGSKLEKRMEDQSNIAVGGGASLTPRPTSERRETSPNSAPNHRMDFEKFTTGQ